MLHLFTNIYEYCIGYLVWTVQLCYSSVCFIYIHIFRIDVRCVRVRFTRFFCTFPISSSNICVHNVLYYFIFHTCFYQKSIRSSFRSNCFGHILTIFTTRFREQPQQKPRLNVSPLNPSTESPTLDDYDDYDDETDIVTPKVTVIAAQSSDEVRVDFMVDSKLWSIKLGFKT